MFQFRRFPTHTYLIQHTLTRSSRAGFPHSEICGSIRICHSPQLIAACHVLLRLLMPRHSPCALFSLTCKISLRCSCSRIMQALSRLFVLRNCRFTLLDETFHNFASSIRQVSLPGSSLLPCFSSHSFLHCSVFKVRSPVSFETGYLLTVSPVRTYPFSTCLEFNYGGP